MSAMDISVPNRFNSVASPLPGTKHLNPTPTARARLALLAKATDRRACAAVRCDARAYDIRSRAAFSCGAAASMRNCGGDLHVDGSARDPQVTGGFELLRGSLRS